LTPTVSRVEAGKGQTIRILGTGGNFPADRETLLWFNLLEAPFEPQTAASESYLQIAGRARIRVRNRSPYHMTFNALRVRAQEAGDDAPMLAQFQPASIADTMVAPLADLLMPLNGQIPVQIDALEVVFDLINDQGGITTRKAQLNGWP